MEGGHGEFGDGADDVVGDGAVVDLVDGDDFGAGAGEEEFVGGVEVVTGEVAFLEGDVGGVEEADDDLAGDADEDAAVFWGGGDDAVFDHEDVVAGAFADVAEVIEHDGFGDAGVVCFPLGHDVIEVVEGFDFGGEGVGVIADGGGGDDGHTVGVHSFGVHLDFVGDAEDGGSFAIFGGDAEVADAAGDDEAEVAVGEVIGVDGLFHGVGEFWSGVGDGEADGGGGFVEAVEVGVFFEDASVVLADAFEDAISVEEAVVVDGDFGLMFGDELSVDPDLQFAVGGIHKGFPKAFQVRIASPRLYREE